MSKELEALDNLIGTIRILCENQIGLDKFEEDYDTIKQALTELQAIKEANPSEALKCVNELWQDINIENDFRNDFKRLKTIEQSLLKMQEQAKVLEIIENKNVDILDIRMSKTVDNYNFAISSSNLNRKELTQEEFDTLKRYCENGL